MNVVLNETYAPAFLIQANNNRFSIQQEVDVMEVVVNERIDAPSTFTIRMSDVNMQWIDHPDFSEGSVVSISLGYKDSVEELMNGEITALYPGFTGYTGNTLVIKGCTQMHRLKRGRKTRSFEEMTDSDIISEIAGSVGLGTDVDPVGSQHLFTVQRDQTDYDYIMMLANKFDCSVYTKDGTLFFKKREENQADDAILEWGKTLKDFHPRLESDGLISEVEVRGWNSTTDETVVFSKTVDDVVDVIGGNCLGGAKVRENFGDAKMVFVDKRIKDINSAEQAALDLITRNSMNYINAEGQCEGHPGIRAGKYLEIKEVGKRFSGKYFVKGAKHHLISGRGYSTKFNLSRNAVGE
ncbi:MAG: phage late control D family protein [bacterium]|nr:phage late control D family protein [bacterium]